MHEYSCSSHFNLLWKQKNINIYFIIYYCVVCSCHATICQSQFFGLSWPHHRYGASIHIVISSFKFHLIVNLPYFDVWTEDSYQQQAVIDGEAALLDILDTAGQVEFTAMRDQYMRCGEGFIICYSVTDRHSFQEALEYRKLITRVRFTEDIPLVLIANKLDLQSQRKVCSHCNSLR